METFTDIFMTETRPKVCAVHKAGKEVHRQASLYKRQDDGSDPGKFAVVIFTFVYKACSCLLE